MEQALSRTFDYQGQYKHVETLIVCMFNSTSLLFPVASADPRLLGALCKTVSGGGVDENG